MIQAPPEVFLGLVVLILIAPLIYNFGGWAGNELVDVIERLMHSPKSSRYKELATAWGWVAEHKLKFLITRDYPDELPFVRSGAGSVEDAMFVIAGFHPAPDQVWSVTSADDYQVVMLWHNGLFWRRAEEDTEVSIVEPSAEGE